jgi:hypothetical protein
VTIAVLLPASRPEEEPAAYGTSPDARRCQALINAARQILAETGETSASIQEGEATAGQFVEAPAVGQFRVRAQPSGQRWAEPGAAEVAHGVELEQADERAADGAEGDLRVGERGVEALRQWADELSGLAVRQYP